MRKLYYSLLSILLISSILFVSTVSNPSGTNVIISEVLYDAPNSDATEEWIELYNPTSSAIDLTGWSVSDNAGTFSLSGTIPAHGYYVIARDAAAFNALYGFNPSISGSSLALSNSGDQVILKNGGTQVDFVAWENYVSGWTVAAKNAVIHRDSDVDTDSPSDWSAPGNLGTPMASNGPNFGNSGPDTTPPTVTIDSPAAGATVSGTVTISMSATDPSGIVSYEILIDGVLKSTATSYSWDTTLETDGSHTILARAQDGAGNWGESSISVTVSNGGNPPPPPPSSGAFKVMEYNVEQSGLNPDWKQVVKEENADIIVFIETGTWDDNNNALLNQYVNEFNAYFTNELPYSGVVTQGISFSTSGEAVMSRYPIVSTNQIPTLTLDDGTSFTPSHEFLDVAIDVDGTVIHVIASHLKCCSGSTNENKRERAQEGIINYIDSLGNVPVIYMGDLNSFSPEDVGPLAPNGNLGVGPMSMMVDTTNPTYSSYASTVHTWTDAFRSLNPNDPGYSYGHQNPTYSSRIDFIVASEYFNGYMVSSTVGDTATADTGSDHYSVDVIIDFGGTVDTTPPAQVTGLSANVVSDTQIDLSWNANSEADLASYNIYRDGVLLTSTTATSYSDTGLTASTTYSYQVSAVDTSNNEGTKSTTVSATTNAPADTTPPAQVTGLTATATGETTVDLSWNANSEADLSHYNIYRDGVLLTTTTGTTYTDTGLTALTTYSYQVSAVDTSNNEGTKSTSASVTTPDLTPPGQVSGLTATATGETTVDLSWNANGEADLSHYNIYRDGVLLTTTTATTYTDSGLTAKTTYSYSVSAVDASGNEGSAATASVTTPDLTPPGQVTGLSAVSVGQSQIDLTWTASSAADFDHYNVYRDGVLVASVTTASYSDTGLSASTTYTYEVSAVDASGNEGARSAPSSATTAAPSLGHIIISEVMYDVSGKDSLYEWVELYNPTGAAVDLSGWTLSDNAGTFTLPSGTVIQAGQYLVIARDSTSFQSRYGFAPDVGGMNLALGNKGDWLTLRNAAGADVDFVAWENKVSGWNIYAGTDSSIARISVNVDTDTVADWHVVSGGTPGTA